MKEDLEAASVTLDRFYRAILHVLQRDNKAPQRKIAEMVNLSAQQFSGGSMRLEETEIIQSNIAVIDPAKVGQSITLFVQVAMRASGLISTKAPSERSRARRKSNSAITLLVRPTLS